MQAAREVFDRECRKGVFAGPVAEDVIKEAEAALGVSFPSEYRDFLARYGAAVCSLAQIYGLPDALKNDPPFWQDVTVVTRSLRNGGVCADDPALVAFAGDGTGVYFAFDTSVSPGTKIVAIGPGVDKVVADSLYSFSVDWAAGKIQI